MTSRSTWQRHERRTAQQFGGERTPSGVAGADVVTDSFSVECKCWRNLPARVVDALQQAERSATNGQTPMAIIHQTGQRHDGDLVILRRRDFDRMRAA